MDILSVLDFLNKPEVKDGLEETARLYFTSDTVTINLVWSAIILGLIGLALKPIFGIPLLENILGACRQVVDTVLEDRVMELHQEVMEHHLQDMELLMPDMELLMQDMELQAQDMTVPALDMTHLVLDMILLGVTTLLHPQDTLLEDVRETFSPRNKRNFSTTLAKTLRLESVLLLDPWLKTTPI